MTHPPDWVRDLLGLWAHQDWAAAQGELGYPTVSPMFSRAVGTQAECEDVTGYSSEELRVMGQAIDWLQSDHPEHWRALSRSFRPWTRAALERKDGDEVLAIEAAILIANFMDQKLD